GGHARDRSRQGSHVDDRRLGREAAGPDGGARRPAQAPDDGDPGAPAAGAGSESAGRAEPAAAEPGQTRHRHAADASGQVKGAFAQPRSILDRSGAPPYARASSGLAQLGRSTRASWAKKEPRKPR